VPADYLLKVLARLTRAGVLSASRGVNGGYRLARDADRIPLMDVVRPFEGERTEPRCLLRPGEPCRERDSCGAHDAWCVVQGTYQEFLANTTVADIQHDCRPKRRPSSRKKARGRP
jgi:Rrf2 family protein